MKIEQWDIVRFRINTADRDLHPGVVVSAAEWCADDRKLRLNVLACSQLANRFKRQWCPTSPLGFELQKGP